MSEIKNYYYYYYYYYYNGGFQSKTICYILYKCDYINFLYEIIVLFILIPIEFQEKFLNEVASCIKSNISPPPPLSVYSFYFV